MSDGQRVVIMGCAHSAGEALQALQDRGRELPANVEWVELTCGGMLDELYILRALESGARGVMVLSCCDGACRSVDGSEWAGKRVQTVRDLLSEAGLPTEGLVYHTMAPPMAADLWGWIQDLSA